MAPLSSEYRELGNSFLYSLQMALEEIGDKDVFIIPRDSGYNNKEKLDSAIREIKSQGAKIIIGPISHEEFEKVKNYKKLVQEHRALGELDHPDDSVINLRNASHMVTDIWMEDKAVMGKVKVLNTPSGQVLQSLVESGVKLGISSRGMGSVSESNDATVVQEDFQLICFDFVSEPSTPNAFMMKEAKDYNNQVFTKADRINRLLNEVLDSD